MSEQDRQEAREHLSQARRQAGQAARHATKAAKIVGEVAAEETGDALRHSADEVKEVASDVAEETKRVAPKFSARGLAAISSDTGIGFMALSVSIYSGAIAFYKFKAAFDGRGRAIG